MRARFPEVVERGRCIRGELRTSPGDTFGLFRLKHPSTLRSLKVIVGDGLGWDHVSVSNIRKVPTWDEMCWVKSLFFNATECVVQYHPSVEDYVNVCGNCLHIWRPQQEQMPTPPLECV